MFKNNRSRLLIIVMSFFLFLGSWQIRPAQAQNKVEFSETEVINHFPDEMIFRVQVKGPGIEIQNAKFAFTTETLYGSRSYTKEKIEFEPGAEVVLEYTLDTRDLTTPPMMPYLFHWEVEDNNGDKYHSEPVTFRYADNRYDWQVLENEDIGVWWHDRPQSFGQNIFDIAAAAVANQQELFQAELDFQMRIVISNTNEEFHSWHNIEHDWIGGQTFSDYGFTNQIVKEESFQETWLNGVIPHEISHIFFNQAVYNPVVSVPVWLNEGVAQYNEFISHDWEINQVESAAKDKKLIPLTSLEDGFGSYDVERVYLSYAEAYSAAAYLVERYGNAGLSTLLKAYQDGEPTDQAFQIALGISADQFELGWAESVGAENYLIPTARALPTFFPSPTSYFPGGQGTKAPGQDPAGTPTPSTTDFLADNNETPSHPFQLDKTNLMVVAAIIIAVLSLIFLIRKKQTPGGQDRNE